METERFKRITDSMKKHNLEQIIISSPASIFYLTGLTIEPGERMLAIYINTNGDKKLFVNELFTIKDDLGIDVCWFNDYDDPIEKLAAVVEDKTIGIDKDWPSHFLISLIDKKPNLKFINGSSIVDEVRMVKDAKEIELMKKASRVNDKVIADIISMISKDKTEKDMCKLLAEVYAKYGTDSFSFYPLVAFGKNAASPHHSSDDSTLQQGDCVLFDIGGKTNDYCSDMTRTVFFKQPSEEDIKVYNTVLQANLAGIKAVKPGVKLFDIDKAARDVIEAAGYGKYFTHRLGHNVGIDVHEFPGVGENNDLTAKPGMIFSIEPGIYIEGKVGVRIEDLVLVTEDGCEVLNNYTKELQVL